MAPEETERSTTLEAAIDSVVASYDGPEEINNLESAALPNARAVVQAFRHLTYAIYMGFYSTRGLNRSNLKYSISEHLYPAHELLVQQISRAVSYYDAAAARAEPRGDEWASAVVKRLLHRLPDLRRCLNSDVVAAYAGDPAAKGIEEVVFSYPSVRAVTAHRVAHVLYSEGVPMIPRILAEHAHAETGIDIHAGARIGDHFFIDHGTGVVIGETCVIGSRVKLYQGVTLGALSTVRGDPALEGKRHPTLEDDVTIYAGATILGGDTVIGRGATIGGNVWIVKSVAAGEKVFGRSRE